MVSVEEAVQVEKMIAALMIMPVPVVAVTRIPDVLNLIKGVRLALVEVLYQISVHFLTIAHPLRRDLECFVEEVVMTGDNVDKVPNASGGVVCSV